MLIQISIEKTEPLTGSAAIKGSGPVRFVGWLELLRAIADLVGADGRSGDWRPDPAEEPSGEVKLRRDQDLS
jgi:hypothetical protein